MYILDPLFVGGGYFSNHVLWRSFFFPLSDIMDLRHQSSAMRVMLEGKTITVVCNERKPHTSHYPSRPVTTKNNQQTTHTSHYPSRQVETSCNDIQV